MKTRSLYFFFGLILSLAGAATPPRPPAESTPGSHERVELKVLKVYSAKDGDAVFIAYVVEWKGQEVIVSDTLVKTHYQVGDMASVLVMKAPFPNRAEPYDLLHFQMMLQRK